MKILTKNEKGIASKYLSSYGADQRLLNDEKFTTRSIQYSFLHGYLIPLENLSKGNQNPYIRDDSSHCGKEWVRVTHEINI